MAEKKNYYAVRIGRVPGIYQTWDECKKNVHGFPGAIYKGFKTLTEAEAFMSDMDASFESQDIEEAKEDYGDAIAYVDGSYNIETGEYSYGMLIYYDGEEYEYAEKYDDPQRAGMRNVAGEIEGSMHAMQFCLDRGIKSVEIYYDYAGIEEWALGRWKTNKDATMAYKLYYDSIKSRLKVIFHKVKGHSGDKGNDRADALAKGVLGIK